MGLLKQQRQGQQTGLPFTATSFVHTRVNLERFPGPWGPGAFSHCLEAPYPILARIYGR
jgi:hypothetical protein